MTIQSVIKEVCAAVGVAIPTASVIPMVASDRTTHEMMAVANEMAQRIAWNTRDWTTLRRFGMINAVEPLPDQLEASYPLPPDYRRMTDTGNVYCGYSSMPMRFVSDPDEWLRTSGRASGEWMLQGANLVVRPVAEFGTPYRFPYISRHCVKRSAGADPLADSFQNDDDVFVLDERLLKLGMIWQWKAQKGGSYVEDMQNYEDALAYHTRHDKPSPILIGGLPRYSEP
jgi:hypothetical protein